MKSLKYLTVKNILLAAISIALILIFSRLTREWSFPDTSWEIRKDEKIKLKPGYSIEQKFSSAGNNLSKMEILFGKSNSIAPGGKMILQILTEDCGDLIRESSVKFKTLDSDNTYKFIFSKIKNSQNEMYCLRLSFKSKKERSKSAEVFVIENPPMSDVNLRNEKYENAESEKISELEEKSLSLRPSYEGDNWRQNLTFLNERISQYKPWFLKGNYLFAIAFSFLIISIIAVVLLILL